MLLVCYYLLNSQNILISQQTVKKGWFLRHLRRKLKKLRKFHRKKSDNWPMGSFIHNGSEMTTWMGYNFKTKRAKFQATFLIFFELQAAVDHYISTSHWSCTPTH